MTVSAVILEIFNVKEWTDLEIWVCGRSRSLKKARFDRPFMTITGLLTVTGISVYLIQPPGCHTPTRVLEEHRSRRNPLFLTLGLYPQKSQRTQMQTHAGQEPQECPQKLN